MSDEDRQRPKERYEGIARSGLDEGNPVGLDYGSTMFSVDRFVTGLLDAGDRILRRFREQVARRRADRP